VVRRRHPLLALRKITIKDVNEYSWVTMPSTAHLEQRLRRLGNDLGDPFDRGVIRSNSSLLVRSMLIDSDLVGLVTLDDVFIEKSKGVLLEIDLETSHEFPDALEPHLIGIVYGRDAGLSTAAAELVSRIKLHCGDVELTAAPKR
jgi:DNA-binding transcriptional LysR family regulator